MRAWLLCAQVRSTGTGGSGKGDGSDGQSVLFDADAQTEITGDVTSGQDNREKHEKEIVALKADVKKAVVCLSSIFSLVLFFSLVLLQVV